MSLFIIKHVIKISSSYLILSWQGILRAYQSSHESKPRSHFSETDLSVSLMSNWREPRRNTSQIIKSGQKLAETNIKPEHNFHDRFQHWAPVRTPMPELGFKPDRAAYGIAVWAYDCLNLLETSLGLALQVKWAWLDRNNWEPWNLSVSHCAKTDRSRVKSSEHVRSQHNQVWTSEPICVGYLPARIDLKTCHT